MSEIKAGDMLPNDLHILPETGEAVPSQPDGYTAEGVPFWEFHDGDIFPMTGEVCRGPSTIYCMAASVRRPPKLTFWQRLRGAFR